MLVRLHHSRTWRLCAIEIRSSEMKGPSRLFQYIREADGDEDGGVPQDAVRRRRGVTRVAASRLPGRRPRG